MGTDLKTTSVSQAKGTIERANGSSIKFKNKYYQPYNCYSSLQCFLPGTECLVIEAFDGSLWATIEDCVYSLKEVKKHKSVSQELDDDVKQEHPKKIYIPPMTHPWKALLFKKQQKKAHTTHVYA